MQQNNPARLNLIFAYVSLFCYGLADNIRGPVYPEIRDHFGLSDSQGSWFFALTSGVAMLAGLGIAWPLRRSSYLKVFRFSLLVLFVSQVVFATASSFPMFLTGALLFGVASGFLGVLQNMLVMVAATGPRLSRLLNGLHANYGLSSLLAPLLVSFASFFSNDFRAGFWGVAFASLVVGIASLRVSAFHEPVPAVHKETKHEWPRRLGVMAAIFSLYIAAEVLIGTRIAQFTREHAGADLRESGAWTSLFFVGLFAGRLLFSFFHPGFSPRSQLVAGFLASALFGAAGIWISPWFFGVMGLTMGPCYPLAMSVLSRIFSAHLSLATRICITGGSLLLILLHLAVGQIRDLLSIQGAMMLAPIGLLMAGVLIFALPREPDPGTAHA